MPGETPQSPISLEPDIAFNRRGLLAPAQTKFVSPLATLGGTELAMLLSIVPIGALGFFSFVGFAIAIWLGFAVFLTLAVPCAFAVRAILRSAEARKRAAPNGPAVRGVDGVVRFALGGWQAFESTPTGPRSLGKVALPPGPFRFYVFAGTVVGAESTLGPGDYSIGDTTFSAGFNSSSGETHARAVPIGDVAQYAEQLGKVVGFEARDVAANRAGHRSQGQGVGPIAKIEGVAQIRYEAPDKMTTHLFVVVDGRRFSISKEASTIVVPGIRHRVYFDPQNERLLSLEPS